MKEKFKEFYPATEQELNDIWTTGIISLDANVLLNLYRYSDDTRNNFLEAIKLVQDRVWITFQAGYEFHRNRTTTIRNVKKAYKKTGDELEKILTNTEKDIKKNINRHRYSEVEPLIKKLKTCIEEISNDIKERDEKHPNLLKEDHILEELSKIILDDKIGVCFTEEEYKNNFKEGKRRYDAKIPPGYKDSVKQKETNDGKRIYGDFLIWEELIAKSKSSEKPILFITDDAKDDWWLIEGTQTIMPCEELLIEFKARTGNHILISKSPAFLYKFNPNKESSVEEINSIQNRFKKIDFIELYKEAKNSPYFMRLRGLKYMPIASQEAASQLCVNDMLILLPEPENIYDKNAIKVLTKDNIHIGYIPTSCCDHVLSMIKKNEHLNAKVGIINNTETIPFIDIKLK